MEKVTTLNQLNDTLLDRFIFLHFENIKTQIEEGIKKESKLYKARQSWFVKFTPPYWPKFFVNDKDILDAIYLVFGALSTKSSSNTMFARVPDIFTDMVRLACIQSPNITSSFYRTYTSAPEAAFKYLLLQIGYLECTKDGDKLGGSCIELNNLTFGTLSNNYIKPLVEKGFSDNIKTNTKCFVNFLLDQLVAARNEESHKAPQLIDDYCNHPIYILYDYITITFFILRYLKDNNKEYDDYYTGTIRDNIKRIIDNTRKVSVTFRFADDEKNRSLSVKVKDGKNVIVDKIEKIDNKTCYTFTLDRSEEYTLQSYTNSEPDKNGTLNFNFRGKKNDPKTNTLFNGAIVDLKMPTEKWPSLSINSILSLGLVENTEHRQLLASLLNNAIKDENLRSKLRVLLLLDEGQRKNIIEGFVNDEKTIDTAETGDFDKISQSFNTYLDKCLDRINSRFNELSALIEGKSAHLESIITENVINRLDEIAKSDSEEFKSLRSTFSEIKKTLNKFEKVFNKAQKNNQDDALRCLEDIKRSLVERPFSEYPDVLKKGQDELKNYVTKTWKLIKYLTITGGILIGIAVVICGLVNVSSLRTRCGIIYGLADALPWLVYNNSNMAYDRASYLEEKATEHYIKSVGKNQNPWAYIENPKNRPYFELRHESAQRYREAIRQYAKTIENEPQGSLSPESIEKAKRLAEMYFAGKGGVIDYNKGLEYAELANKYGSHNQGLYAYGLLMTGSPLVEVKKVISNPLLDSIADPYLGFLHPAVKILEMAETVSPDPKAIYAALNKLELYASGDKYADLAALTFATACLQEGVKDKNNRYIIHKWPYASFQNAFGMALEMNYLPAQRMLASLMDIYGVKDAYYGYLLAAYNGDKTSAVIAGNMLTDPENFAREHPVLKEETGSNSMGSSLVAFNISSQNKDYNLAHYILKDVAGNIEDGAKLHMNVPDADLYLLLSQPDSAKELRKKFSEAPINNPHFLRELSESDKRRALDAYIDGIYYAEGFGDKTKDDKVADSLFHYASSLGLEDAAYTLGRRLIERKERQAAYDLLGQFAYSSDRINCLASESFKIIDPLLSEHILSSISDTLNIYKNIRETMIYLESGVRDLEKDARHYVRIMDSWNPAQFSTKKLNREVELLLLAICPDSEREFFKNILIWELSDESTSWDSLIELYPDVTDEFTVMYAVAQLCEDKTFNPAFNRSAIISELQKEKPEVLDWLVTNGKVSEMEVSEAKETMLYPVVCGSWRELELPYYKYSAFRDLYKLD